MTVYFTASGPGFLRSPAALPADAVPITDAEHTTLMAGQAAGQQIVPDADGRPVLVWPDPAPVTAEQVKAEARSRIIAIADEDRQRNMTARGLELLRQGPDTWTPEEQAEVDAIDAIWQQIKAIRAASDTIEAMSPIPADFTDPAYWP
jgi:hypothetical protein